MSELISLSRSCKLILQTPLNHQDFKKKHHGDFHGIFASETYEDIFHFSRG